MKNNIYYLILGMLLFGVLTVSATIMLQPTEVSFSSDKTSQTTVKGALDELYDISRGECPVGHVCTTCSAGTYANQETGECLTCPTGYTSDTGAGKIGDCYIETTAGKYIANANDSVQTTCPVGSYCPSTKIKYGSTGNTVTCPEGYTSDAGAIAENKCYITTTGGKYIKTAGTSTQTQCPAGSYCPSATIYYGSTGNIQSCGSGKTSNAGSSSSSACKSNTYTKTSSNGFWIGTYTCVNGRATLTGCKYTGVYGTATCSGTNALHLCTYNRTNDIGTYCSGTLPHRSVPGGNLPAGESC